MTLLIFFFRKTGHQTEITNTRILNFGQKKITTLSTCKSKICFCYIKINKKKNFLESSKIRLNMHARANLSRKITVFSGQYLFYIWRLFTGSVHTSDKIYEFRYNYINILPHFQTVSRHVSGCMSYI